MQTFDTLGKVLRGCLECFAGLKDDEIGNDPAKEECARVLLTGVAPALSTPTSFLRDNLCCADFAVHITVVQPQASELRRGFIANMPVIAESKDDHQVIVGDGDE
jgi:hypothetical protein